MPPLYDLDETALIHLLSRLILYDPLAMALGRLAPCRLHHHPFDRQAYRRRNLVERCFSRLKDWRRVATRYDKLAPNFAAAVAITATVIYWL